MGENEKRVFIPVMTTELTRKQKREALRIVSLIKKKRCGKIKARIYADGRKRRKYVEKESVASPTVHLESLFATLAIDAREHRNVATVDVGGAFLLSKVMEFILVKMEGEEVDALVRANPQYGKYVTTERGKKVIYLRLRTALY